jgi:hypothetical protein
LIDEVKIKKNKINKKLFNPIVNLFKVSHKLTLPIFSIEVFYFHKKLIVENENLRLSD